MGFAQLITDCRGQENGKSARQLRADLRKNGRPEPHDLGGLQSLRARYAELSGAEFDRVLNEVSKRRRA